MNKMIVIDGNSLLFRAYYATAFNQDDIMRNKDGVPTNAIFAFSNMINRILSEIDKGDYIMVAFDTGKHTFRHEALETYKANRKPVPQELITQFPIAREYLRAMNIFQFEQEGFEGDDIAGTVARQAEKQGLDVYIYTSDRDFLQLVDDKIKVKIIKKGLSDVMTMTPSLVKETYGFEPKQIIDYKGLRGDSSDNLPGIPGVGEKTAIKLIQEYNNFDNIVENSKTLKGKVYESIVNNQDLGRLCRDLAIIKDDIDIPFIVEDTKYEGYKLKIISEFCQQYDLKQYMNKVSNKWRISDEYTKEIKYEIRDNFKNINLGEDIGINVELDDDSDYYSSNIIGVSISTKEKNYYIYYEDLLKDEYLLSVLKSDKVRKYSFDYKKNKVSLHTHGVELNNNYFDLLIACYLLNSSIKNDIFSILKLFEIDVKENNENSLFTNANPYLSSIISSYSLSLERLVKTELVKINALDLYQNLELPLVDTLVDMEIEGFPLNKNVLQEYGDTYKVKLEELKNKIYELAGEEFNISSPKQLANILFEKLGLPQNKKMSTSVEILNELRKYHPIIDNILEYRKYFKLNSTYVEGLIPHIKSDGKIHCSFNQALTQTGRLSSSNPNLQNISIRDEEGKMIRKAFFYEDENYEILSLDYSQIELRVLAALANSKSLKDVFIEGKDIHTETAKKIFHLTEEPTSEQRRKAKTVNFGIIYGISDWGLSEQLQISIYEARQIINSFYESFPEIKQFFQSMVDEALKFGYSQTLLGRRRYLNELHDSNYQTREFAKRAAMNAPIQGTAADLIKLAMNKCAKILKENNYDSKMVLQIHDELIFKVNKKEKDIVYKTIKETMEGALNISIPLEVDGGFGKDWYSAK
ncbi:MAG: DNA polymerase I [Bacilli bacterium]